MLLMMSGRKRFILGHAESPTYKEGNGPHRLFKTVKKRWGAPQLLVTDKRPEFGTAHREIFARNPEGKASKHLYETHDRGQRFSNNVMERLNGAVRDHLKAARRIKKVT